mmetsp:Transcript_9535/g.21162  ORF Transcript_9535/g.21162 Transcript_9535/m.21162 type:complete len:221 (-) Transcript_9535:910-1572(-)
MDTPSRPLLDSEPDIFSQTETMIQFYDEECAIAITADIAYGYLILLGGPPVAHETPNLKSTYAKIDDTHTDTNPLDDDTVNTHLSAEISGDPQLAMAAITYGNVIDACVGGSLLAKATKDFLCEAAEANPVIAVLSIRAYRRCFLIVRGYYAALESCAILGPCCHERQIRRVAYEELSKAFAPLILAVKECTFPDNVANPGVVQANYSSYPEKVEISISG